MIVVIIGPMQQHTEQQVHRMQPPQQDSQHSPMHESPPARRPLYRSLSDLLRDICVAAEYCVDEAVGCAGGVYADGGLVSSGDRFSSRGDMWVGSRCCRL
ncbi:hypothetical protein H4S02_003276, partial [Coemansia sp. RSA 2611]